MNLWPVGCAWEPATPATTPTPHTRCAEFLHNKPVYACTLVWRRDARGHPKLCVLLLAYSDDGLVERRHGPCAHTRAQSEGPAVPTGQPAPTLCCVGAAGAVLVCLFGSWHRRGSRTISPCEQWIMGAGHVPFRPCAAAAARSGGG